MTTLVAVHAELPEHRYPQAELTDLFARLLTPDPPTPTPQQEPEPIG